MSTLANRMYYAAYHAVMALLIHNKLHACTHLGVSVLLNKHFVKEGVISTDESRLFTKLEALRESGDYNCYIDTSEDDLLPKLQPTKDFINHIKSLVR